jgi:hypothetical protein
VLAHAVVRGVCVWGGGVRPWLSRSGGGLGLGGGVEQGSRESKREGLPCGLTRGLGPSGGGRECCAWGPPVNDTGTLTSGPGSNLNQFKINSNQFKLDSIQIGPS